MTAHSEATHGHAVTSRFTWHDLERAREKRTSQFIPADGVADGAGASSAVAFVVTTAGLVTLAGLPAGAGDEPSAFLKNDRMDACGFDILRGKSSAGRWGQREEIPPGHLCFFKPSFRRPRVLSSFNLVAGQKWSVIVGCALP